MDALEAAFPSAASSLSGDTISDEEKIAKGGRTNERYRLFVRSKNNPSSVVAEPSAVTVSPRSGEDEWHFRKPKAVQ